VLLANTALGKAIKIMNCKGMKNMKLGSASWGFRETPLEEQLKITNSLGLKYLELGFANGQSDLPLHCTHERLDEVKALFNKYGVYLECGATGNDFTNGNLEDLPKIYNVIDMCSYLGIKYLRIFAGFSHVEEVVGSRWDIMLEGLTKVYEYARDKNVVPVIETHGGVDSFDDGVIHFYSTSSKPEILLKMLEELPSDAKICYDPANLYAVGIKEPDTVYQMIKDKVCYMHIKDFSALPSGRILPSACGESNMDWKKILKGIGNFDGPMLLEYENTEDVKDGLDKCKNYIINTLEELKNE